jgi:oligopeptide transport system ATP-binding protein
MSNNRREKLLEVQNLSVTFGSKRAPFRAVDDVSFHIYKGETFRPGGGVRLRQKPPSAASIIRINPISGGAVLYKGERISGRISREMDRKVTRSIQMIFQDPMASLNERAKVSYIVSEGLYAGGHRLTEAEKQEKVAKALSDVGLLPEFASRFPHEFSGGQRQRIGIARALIMNPEFIIADEPISALDVSIRAQVLNLMGQLQKERGLTYLFIAHDLSVVRFISDRIAVIHKGKLVELAESEQLFAHPLHPYTRALLSAIPMPDPASEKRKKLLVYDPSCHDYTQDGRYGPSWSPATLCWVTSGSWNAFGRCCCNGILPIAAPNPCGAAIRLCIIEVIAMFTPAPLFPAPGSPCSAPPRGADGRLRPPRPPSLPGPGAGDLPLVHRAPRLLFRRRRPPGRRSERRLCRRVHRRHPVRPGRLRGSPPAAFAGLRRHRRPP